MISGPTDMRMKSNIRIITTIAMKLFPLITPHPWKENSNGRLILAAVPGECQQRALELVRVEHSPARRRRALA